MKKSKMNLKICGILSLSLCTSALAAETSPEFSCKSAYDTKFARIEKHRKNRDRLPLYTGIAIGVPSMIVLAPISIGGAIWIGAAGGFMGGFFGATAIDSAFNREDGLHEAYLAQILMFESESSHLMKYKEAYKKDFDQKIVNDPSFRNYILTLIDQDRSLHNMPNLDIEKPGEVSKSLHDYRDKTADKLEIDNPITRSLLFAQKRSSMFDKWTYDQWRQYLIQNQDKFCENGRALTLNKAVKKLI